MPARSVRVLAIQPRVTQRDTIELMHRTDMDVTVVFSDFAELPERARAVLPRDPRLAAERHCRGRSARAWKARFDVILLGPVDRGLFYEVLAERLKERWSTAARPGLHVDPRPQGGRSRATKKPSQGSGLRKGADRVARRRAAAAVLTAGVPFEALPGFRIDREGQGQGFSQGRGAVSVRPGPRDALRSAGGWGLLANAPDTNDLHYEYYQSFAIKSILWAAGKEPAVAADRFPRAKIAAIAARTAGASWHSGLTGGRGSTR